MKKIYEKPIIEINEYDINETLTTSSNLNNVYGEDILEDSNAVIWDW